MALNGIFFDEVASEYSPERAEYLKVMNQVAKNASGLQLEKTVSHSSDTAGQHRAGSL